MMQMQTLGIQQFESQMQALTSALAHKALDVALEQWLNAHWGSQSERFLTLKALCIQGVEEGWLCQREAGGLRYGRVFKPSDALQGFSVDVVRMDRVIGPHHVHPMGEIDLIMPIDDGATFDGHGAGWLVYPPMSAHSPTVSHGLALVLYLLPQGQIQFSSN